MPLSNDWILKSYIFLKKTQGNIAEGNFSTGYKQDSKKKQARDFQFQVRIKCLPRTEVNL